MSPAASRHRPRVLTAAVTVIADRGARALTHGAVDRGAGVPPGTTSNYFRTRDALLGGVLDHLVAEDERNLARITAGRMPEDPAALTDLFIAVGEDLLGPARTTTIARYAVFLEAATRPELASRVAESRRRLNQLAADLLQGLGAKHAEVDAQRIMFTLDGYILASTSHGAVDATLREVLEPVVASAFD